MNNVAHFATFCDVYAAVTLLLRLRPGPRRRAVGPKQINGPNRHITIIINVYFNNAYARHHDMKRSLNR